MTKQVFQTTFAGRELVVETGQVAKQANGAVVVRYGESTVLTAAVMSKKMATGDFFPLQVNYEEKMYAAGKFPGSFFCSMDNCRILTDHKNVHSHILSVP